MSNLVNDRLVEAVKEFINEYPNSIYAEILHRKKSQHDWEGMFEVLKSAQKWSKDNG